MQLHVLASGSAANSAVIVSGDTSILVDAGLGWRETFERLIAAGVNPEKLSAVAISHSHGDHSNGLEGIARRVHCPVYMTHGTATALAWESRTGDTVLIAPGQMLTVGGVDFMGFSVPHDADDPVSYSFSEGPDIVTVATDFGEITEEMAAMFCQSDVLMIESNHDRDMLMATARPLSLKHRVAGSLGHLSNEQLCSFIREHQPDVRRLILGHVSAEANNRELVKMMAQDALYDVGMSAVKLEVV